MNTKEKMEIHFSPGHQPHNQAQIYGDDGKTLAITYDDDGAAFAEKVCRAVNTHDASVAAMRAALEIAEANGPVFLADQLRAALALAEGV